jgi:branched-chain amino acid transport system ATP-binding protein
MSKMTHSSLVTRYSLLIAFMLQVSDLHTSYGAIQAIGGVAFEVPRGAVVTLIGANGAGKSTTLNTVSGLLKPRRGQIMFEGRNIAGWSPHRVAALGIIQSPEGRQVIAPLSVHENLRMGAYLRRDREIDRDIAGMFEQFPRLAERRTMPAGALSGGEQQMLAIARALMARPKLLMLDEPSLGLAPLIVRDMFAIIAQIKAQGTTILLVEQNARKALEIADHAYVLEHGVIVASGPAAQLRDDPAIVAAYLGQR